MEAVESKDHLDTFVRSLNTEICRVWEHWNVLKGVHQPWHEYSSEMSQSGQFWRIVSRALQDTIIVRLAATVDPKPDVVSVPNLLRLLQQQSGPKTFGFEFGQQSLLASKDIVEDISAVDRDDPTIKKIRRLRNKIVAHRDMSIVVRDALHELPELPDAEIEALITKLHEMVSKYCRTIGVTPIVLRFPGADDYKSLFRLMRKGFNDVISEHLVRPPSRGDVI